MTATVKKVFVAIALVVLVESWFIYTFVGQHIVTFEQTSIKYILPLPGHWLMTKTDRDKYLNIPPYREKNSLIKPSDNQQNLQNSMKTTTPKTIDIKSQQSAKSSRITEEQEYFHGNKTLDNLNIALLWVDGKKLKALTVTSLNPDTQKIGVASIPLFAYNTEEKERKTVAEMFRTMEFEDCIGKLEEYLETDINYTLKMEQSTFVKISDLIGEININGEETMSLIAFEQTRTDQRRDDQQVVRAVAKKMLHPSVLVVLPKIAWILAKEVETDISIEEMFTVFKLFKQSDTQTIRKKAITGYTYKQEGKKYRAVQPQIWQNILYELTT